ncbi:MAG: 5-amino-6-(D-ribitylamino)uracil--L-tyrosine 4-hydroxyphenyl transferase CofH [Porticoccaceae bacterium]|nr:5-amino-6-(D-ribitylamino)uracil--L-tyrosine 4-hydroxyphenyl transferase CofH [Porticoccaceae bacterium]
MNMFEKVSLSDQLFELTLSREALDDCDALALADNEDTQSLMAVARAIRDQHFGNLITYSKKVFIPLTHLCRDVCHYCTFATTPKQIVQPYMTADDVVAQVAAAAKIGCKEALFTLGEKPELRYRVAREALDAMGFATTIDYVAHVAGRVVNETGVLPHINAGTMTSAEIHRLRRVSASMGIMLESTSERLCEKGMPHYGSPDKAPSVRLQTLDDAGVARVPMTTGLLIGIGETRVERVQSLLAIRDSHRRYGHIQEVIIQNFRAKANTKMAQAPEPDLNELLWTLAVARIIFGAHMSIQVPPNLSPGVLPQLLAAGINDWGGISPVTPDFVNPEAPWPQLNQLAADMAAEGKYLNERLTLYPQYARDAEQWLAPEMRTQVLKLRDGQGLARGDSWTPGVGAELPAKLVAMLHKKPQQILSASVSADIQSLVEKAASGSRLTEDQIARLFAARGNDFAFVCQAADRLRQAAVGDAVTYAVNRNINYTNVCYFKCQFCAFSKGKLSENLRGRPYNLDHEEIARRVTEAWQRGATEVCMQGGIHPDYTGNTYLEILRTVGNAVPEMHIHAFSPLEVWQGAATLGLPLEDYLRQLKDAGLHTLPGTAAEILDDGVRALLCPDKINTDQWLEVMETAHKVGFKTTATIMFGHVDGYQHWARHLLAIRDLQEKTGGFTEFVPLPFVGQEAPIYLKGKARNGPTFREAVLMHAVARLVLNPVIANIQTSWVKMGPEGAAVCLRAGANDLGGTLMNESITKAAGATYGEEFPPEKMAQLIDSVGRIPRQRTTLYGEVSEERRQAATDAVPLQLMINTPLRANKNVEQRQ